VGWGVLSGLKGNRLSTQPDKSEKSTDKSEKSTDKSEGKKHACT